MSYGGDTAVGAYGIANRISFFFVMVVIGINQGMQPIAGYNYGARNFNRLTSTLRYAAIFATIVVTLAFLMAMFAARPCVQAFTSDPELIDKSAHALKMILLVSPVIGIQIVTSGFFQSIGEAKKSIFLSLTRQLLFLIPALPGIAPFPGTRRRLAFYSFSPFGVYDNGSHHAGAGSQEIQAKRKGTAFSSI